MTETVALALPCKVSREQCEPGGGAKANITPESQTESPSGEEALTAARRYRAGHECAA